jgi:Fe-S-cluster containining protein
MIKFRECGECKACCTWLIGEAYGHSFGCGKSCKFLESYGCGIHSERPEMCRKYQCAWSQYLLPEEMRPDKCNVLVSVEQKEGKQYLKVLPINNKKISYEMYHYFMKWSEQMNTPVIMPE